MKEQISVRRLTLIVNATLLLLVLGLMYFFQLIDVSFLVWFSIPALLVYVLGFVLIFSGKFTFYANMVYFWLTLYMGITTVCLGHDYGFHLYCFSVIPTVFVSSYLGHRINVSRIPYLKFSAIIGGIYLLSTGYSVIFGPIYERDAKYAGLFWVFNSLSVLGFLIGYSHYLIRTIIHSEEQLIEIAHYDRLTHLYNRHYMIDRLQALPATEVTDYLAMADIDYFKKINDTYGHNAGDEVLRRISQMMQDHCQDCVISRWGGEEFLILLHTSEQDTIHILDLMRQTIETHPIYFEDQEISVTLTIGAAHREPGQSIDAWIQSVDQKLYDGKHQGRNRLIT